VTRHSIAEYAEVLRERFFGLPEKRKAGCCTNLPKLLACIVRQPSGYCIGKDLEHSADVVVLPPTRTWYSRLSLSGRPVTGCATRDCIRFCQK